MARFKPSWAVVAALALVCGSVSAQTSAPIPPQALAPTLAARQGSTVVTPDLLVGAARSIANQVMDPVWMPDGARVAHHHACRVGR
ncbi:MAG: hypothetical protein WDO68_17345 [Gammaproteobacteria bacterium]